MFLRSAEQIQVYFEAVSSIVAKEQERQSLRTPSHTIRWLIKFFMEKSVVRLKSCCIAATLAFLCFCFAGQAQTRVSAHRGDSFNAPENTIPAFRLAVKKGAPQIELDIHMSRDGKLVLMHDDTVDRTTNGKGRVEDLTFSELRALDAGSWFGPKFAGTQIPTLEEALAVIPAPILCNLHLKGSPGVAAKTVETLVSLGKLSQCFLAATQKQAAEARAVVPTVRICNMSRTKSLEDYAKSTIELHADFLQVRDTPEKKIPEGLAQAVQELHQHHILVNYFSADDEAKIRALQKAGVDYVLTNNLDLTQKVLA